jgi:hypothetical protein
LHRSISFESPATNVVSFASLATDGFPNTGAANHVQYATIRLTIGEYFTIRFLRQLRQVIWKEYLKGILELNNKL